MFQILQTLKLCKEGHTFKLSKLCTEGIVDIVGVVCTLQIFTDQPGRWWCPLGLVFESFGFGGRWWQAFVTLPIRVVILSEYSWPPKVDAWVSWFPYIPWDCLYRCYIWLYLIIFDCICIIVNHDFQSFFNCPFQKGGKSPKKTLQNSCRYPKLLKIIESKAPNGEFAFRLLFESKDDVFLWWPHVFRVQCWGSWLNLKWVKYGEMG